jgi:hypothetical protein
MQIPDHEPDNMLRRRKLAVLSLRFLGLEEGFADRRQLAPADDIDMARVGAGEGG